jgi:hypothetical protein
LAALKERSRSIEHLTFDIRSLAVSKVDTKVEDTPIRMVIMGETYVQRETSDKPNRFVCLVSDKSKVVLTFFTEQYGTPNAEAGSRGNARAAPAQ